MTGLVRLGRWASAHSALQAFSWLAFGALVGQLIQAGAIPALTRIYTPEALGFWAVLQSYVIVAASIGGLRYELALPVVKDQDDARALVLLQIALSTAVTCCAVAAFGAELWDIADLRRHVARGWLLLCVFFVVFGGALFQLASQICVRDRRFRLLTVLRLVNGPGTTAAQVAFGLIAGGRAAALLFGASLGSLGPLVFGFSTLRRYLPSRGRTSLRTLLQVAARFRRFPLFVVPYSLLTLSRDRGLYLLFAAYSDLATVGILAAAQRVVALPMGLVSTAVAPVLHQRLAAAEDRSSLEFGTFRLLRVMIWLGTPFFLILAAFSHWVIPWLLGPGWQRAATLTAVLALSSFTLFMSAVFDRTFDIASRQSTALLIEGSNSIVSLLLAWVMLARGASIEHALLAFVVMNAIHHLVWIATAWRSLGFAARRLAALAGDWLLAIAASGAVVLGARSAFA